jgi:hypothetical protein
VLCAIPGVPPETTVALSFLVRIPDFVIGLSGPDRRAGNENAALLHGRPSQRRAFVISGIS